MIALGWVVNLFQRGDASMGRLAEILNVRPAIGGEEPVQHLPPSATGRTIEFRNVGFHYPSDPGRRAALGSAQRELYGPRRRNLWRRRSHRQRQERAHRSHTAHVRSAGGGDTHRRSADAQGSTRGAASRDRLRSPGESALQRHRRVESLLRHLRFRVGGVGGGGCAARSDDRASFPANTRLSWASAESISRAARNSAHRWHARWRGSRASCCSMTHCPRSTPIPKRRSCARFAKPWPEGPR